MRRVLILVEGQTEERFVKSILQPHLSAFSVHAEPKIVTTKRVKSGPDFKGGVTSFGKVEYDIRLLLGDSNAALITTMLDYYGLPSDFPGQRQLRGSNSRDKAKELEAALQNHFQAAPRFLPYLMIHEFEALLFSAPTVLAQVMNDPSAETHLQRIRNSFATPEDINDDPVTKPSARVLDRFPGYQKVLHGPNTLSRIGLTTIRRECNHFDEWMAKLERLGST
ncbi:MAG: DUF4276 family protein [Deltaproteobacteria bacterium]|nr:DUF4276 family protein [Deltaproteobacteria bacterium]